MKMIAIWRKGVVIRPHFHLESLPFDPTAGIEMIQGLPENLGHVLETAIHRAQVNVVKLRAVGPVRLGIVDFEPQIRRHPKAYMSQCDSMNVAERLVSEANQLG